MTNPLPHYTEDVFAPATHGGLAIHLQTNQGYFYVFGIGKDLQDLSFNYSPDGARLYGEINYTKDYEVDIDFGDGTYDRLKEHIRQTVCDLGLDAKGRELYTAWLKEHEVPERDSDEDRRRLDRMTHLSPETQKKLLKFFDFDNDDDEKEETP